MNESAEIHSVDPYVATYNDIISDEECQHFIKISKPRLTRALVSDNNKGITSAGRTGSNTWINHDHDDITKKIGEKIAKIVNMPLENAEAFQIIYYGPTQEYRQHYDSWEHDGSEKTLRCMKYGGARMKTALCYLNDVKSGGGTRMSKLNITIPPKKGKLLVFHNTVSETDHTRHDLSEHAGMPVEEGEKYAFNLWFKECNHRMLYKDFNPNYYENIKKETPVPVESTTSNMITIDNTQNETKNIIQLHPLKHMFKQESYINENVCDQILKKCNFNNNERRDGWVKLAEIPDLVKKIETTTKINSSFYENINIVEYKENILHNNHFNAFRLNDTNLNQRYMSMTLFLTDNLEFTFSQLQSTFNFNKGDFFFYKNLLDDNITRDPELPKSIICKKNTGYIANIYIRCKDKDGNTFIDSSKNVVNIEPVVHEEKVKENYSDTLNKVFEKFQNDEITNCWSGLNSFKYHFKGNFDRFKNYIKKYNSIRSENKVLIQENLEKEYILDNVLPLQIVDNVLEPSLLNLLQEYYKETISKNVWPLGDNQSNRYKSHNEPMSRFLHYECLPLIEKIVGKSLRPSYTYLSAYVKGADLPPHTDRPDCEYTVSFIIDKPEDLNWNIYVHKEKQPIKHKGRYHFTPPLEECIPVDCNSGGLMLFQGTDHIHFREKLEGDYYNILLLHYCSV
uniref:Ferrochelatase n=1 Tax=Florenciella sp. virus SA2 TaxID=3240092 RepID=A0AB39J9C3_9VIRU